MLFSLPAQCDLLVTMCHDAKAPPPYFWPCHYLLGTQSTPLACAFLPIGEWQPDMMIGAGLLVQR